MAIVAKPHSAEIVGNDGTCLDMVIDGTLFRIRLATCSRRLSEATPAQRMNLDLARIGIDIHWPDVDEDLSVDYLMTKAQTVEGAGTGG
jgi:hypothetical protein